MRLTRHFLNAHCQIAMMLVAVAVFGVCAPGSSAAKEGGKVEAAGILPADDGPSQFAVAGKNSDFGRYMALGEITLADRPEEGLTEGTGVCVLGTVDGDHIVADVNVVIHNGGLSDFTFHWRDSVTFADGREFFSTGRFETFRPAGLLLLGTSLHDNPCCTPIILCCCAGSGCTTK